MHRKQARRALQGASAALLAALMPLAALAQSATPASPVSEGTTAQMSAGAPKGRYGALDDLPDWGGIWFFALSPPGNAPASQPALQGEYAARREAWRAEVAANNGVVRRARSNCSAPGMPRIMRLPQYPYEFLFTPGRITINQEAWMQTRTIWTDGRTHPPLEELDPTFHGHSIGHWEGATLVVDTIGIDDTLELATGAGHSDQLRLIERIYLSPDDPDVLINEMTMIDPVALAEPFQLVSRYTRDRHGALIEFQCAQNDRNPVNEDGETLFE